MINERPARPARMPILAVLLLWLTSACAGGQGASPVPLSGSQGAGTQISAGAPPDVIVYAADLADGSLSELDVISSPASPGNKLISLPNNGDELDPPPENDPHATFQVQVQSGVPYRCSIHMKVGIPKGKSQANVIWVQFTDAIDAGSKEVFKPDTGSYLTAQGPGQEGWSWVGCDLAGSNSSATLVSFRTSGDVTVRLQAGMEGVGFDQFLLSPARFLEKPPSEAVVTK